MAYYVIPKFEGKVEYQEVTEVQDIIYKEFSKKIKKADQLEKTQSNILRKCKVTQLVDVKNLLAFSSSPSMGVI